MIEKPKLKPTLKQILSKYPSYIAKTIYMVFEEENNYTYKTNHEYEINIYKNGSWKITISSGCTQYYYAVHLGRLLNIEANELVKEWENARDENTKSLNVSNVHPITFNKDDVGFHVNLNSLDKSYIGHPGYNSSEYNYWDALIREGWHPAIKISSRFEGLYTEKFLRENSMNAAMNTLAIAASRSR